MASVFDRFAEEGTTVPVDFDPTNEEHTFTIDWFQPDSLEDDTALTAAGGVFEMTQDNVDTARKLTKKHVRGWRGLTARKVQQLGLRLLSDEGVEKVNEFLRKQHGLADDAEPEVPYTPTEAESLATVSRVWRDRVSQLHNSLRAVQAGRESARKKLLSSASASVRSSVASNSPTAA